MEVMFPRFLCEPSRCYCWLFLRGIDFSDVRLKATSIGPTTSPKMGNWLVVSTPLKNISQLG